jgi:hypothetical protein
VPRAAISWVVQPSQALTASGRVWPIVARNSSASRLRSITAASLPGCQPLPQKRTLILGPATRLTGDVRGLRARLRFQRVRFRIRRLDAQDRRGGGFAWTRRRSLASGQAGGAFAPESPESPESAAAPLGQAFAVGPGTAPC